MSINTNKIYEFKLEITVKDSMACLNQEWGLCEQRSSAF